jgi:hypothetical protein
VGRDTPLKFPSKYITALASSVNDKEHEISPNVVGTFFNFTFFPFCTNLLIFPLKSEMTPFSSLTMQLRRKRMISAAAHP